MAGEIVESHTESRWERIRSQWNDLRASVRWIVYAAVIGYLPVLTAEFLRRNASLLGINTDELAGFGLAWGLWITIPCTLIAGVLIVYEVIRFILNTVRGE